MKKALWLTSMSLAGALTLAGCGGNGGDENGNDTNGNNVNAGNDGGEENADASGDDEEIELTFWHIETGYGEEEMESAVDRFEENNPNVTVEVVQHENDPYKTNFNVAMGGGNPPDVFHSWGGGWLQNFVDAGLVRNLTDEIDPDHYLDAALSVATYDDEIYGAPLGMDTVLVWYNERIFDEYGFEEPETYDEFTDIVDTLQGDDIIPLTLANQPQWPGAFYLMYFAERLGGVDLFDEAFTRDGRGFDDEAYVEAGEMIQELVEMNAFPDGFNGMDYDTGQSRQLMYGDRAAMEIMGNWMVGATRDDAPEFEDDLGYFIFPEIEGGEGSNNNIVGGVSPVFSVTEESEHGELAAELVQELTSLETAEAFANADAEISAIHGVEYEDEFTAELAELLEGAEEVQTFYDQTLPSQMAEVHLNTTQALFGLSMTPEEAAQEMEEAAEEYLDGEGADIEDELDDVSDEDVEELEEEMNNNE
ncbi:ABC transporter substrate-binding protein [Alkalicoccus chagannorensis]|uniref:ABC transporter substrate-binding protein n=1 Tax=Alkalicoccus chagannorensis TaxID=427072 RepID=UPI0004043E0D|nr:extracellular solute-binding protein [Alkalicoccus chagannorensis]